MHATNQDGPVDKIVSKLLDGETQYLKMVNLEQDKIIEHSWKDKVSTLKQNTEHKETQLKNLQISA